MVVLMVTVVPGGPWTGLDDLFLLTKFKFFEFLDDNGDDAALDDDFEWQQFLFFMEDEIAYFCALTTEPPAITSKYDWRL